VADETLVVASKVKAYIKARGGMNTSAVAIDALSARVKQLCNMAIEAARKDGRKTIKDRDLT